MSRRPTYAHSHPAASAASMLYFHTVSLVFIQAVVDACWYQFSQGLEVVALLLYLASFMLIGLVCPQFQNVCAVYLKLFS